MEKDLKIYKSKSLADGSKYFSLFEKHIPVLNAGSNVYLYMLGNLPCICEIIQKNPNSKYFIYDSDEVFNCIKILMDGCDISKTVDVYDIDMKFDCIIMNPPYQKNLHLKILAEAIKHLKDDESKVVNLSPVLWIEDPHAHLKPKSNFYKFRNLISTKLKSIDFIDAKTSNELFNIGLFAKLGIYDCGKNDVNMVDVNNIWKRNYSAFEIKLFEKIYKMPYHISDMCENNARDGIRVLIASIAGNRGSLPIYKDLDFVVNGMKNGKDWTKCKNNGGYEKAEGGPIPCSIKFNTENEALNFYNSCKTLFYRFISKRFLLDQNIPLYFLPFMNDYIKPWTNERFKEFFKLTDEEWKYIEDTMAKYQKT